MKHRSVLGIYYWGDSLPITPLLERDFFYGVYDCFALVRDYYRQKSIIIPSPAREFAFWYKDIDMFEQWVQDDSMPFDYVELDDIQKGDILLYNILATKYLNHCAVYLGNGLALHHLYKQKSGKFPLSYHRNSLRTAVRYQND